MPLFIPVLLGGAALLAGGTGAKKGLKGVSQMKEASDIKKECEKKHERALKSLERKRTMLNNSAEKYGESIIQVKSTTFQHFLDFLEAIQRKGEQEKYLDLLDEVEIDAPKLGEFKNELVSMNSAFGGVAGGVVAAQGAGAAASALAGSIGVASTGTAITGLSGAAATNATMAWLGGGALASGGWGMAGGAMVLGGITVAPAVLIGGFVLGKSGEKALTKAKEFEAEADKGIAQLKSIGAFVDRVKKRVKELSDLLQDMDQRANKALDELDPNTFSIQNKSDVKKFQNAGQLVSSISELSKIPILDDDGKITAASGRIKTKQKQMLLEMDTETKAA